MSKSNWLKTGYELVAESGFQQLKIEPLAQLVGISKSSFYHHFADLEVFQEQLLLLHLDRAEVMATKEKNAKTIDPEIIEIILEHRIDLLFHRQLRFHRNLPAFEQAILKAESLIGDALLELWVKDLDLTFSKEQLRGVFGMAMENFFLQIHAENLCKSWLRDYFSQLKKITADLA
jgi:AcrR family transcriptional regulator